MPTTTKRPYAYITTATDSLTTPPGSPKILIHTRQRKVVGIYSDRPAKILQIAANAARTIRAGIRHGSAEAAIREARSAQTRWGYQQPPERGGNIRRTPLRF